MSEESEEKRSNDEHNPEHFGDTILEGVIVRDVVVRTERDELGGIAGYTYGWRLEQERARFYDGPLPLLQERPSRVDVMDLIARHLRPRIALGELRADATEVA